MPRSPSELRKWLALAFFGLIWPGIAARPAQAMGCHVAERPALGLSQSWEQPKTIELLQLDRDAPVRRVLPVPCTGDVPGSFERAEPMPGLPPTVLILPPGGVALVRVPRARLDRPTPLASRLDRPPRALAPLAGSPFA